MTWTTRPRSDFGALKAIRAGEGPQVVLLHGVGLRAEAWNAQIDALSGAFEIIAPDMPGHGESARFAEPPALADFTARLFEAMEGPVLIAGHSMGAMIALDFAIRHPEMTRGVAALNAIYQRSAEAASAVRARANSLDGVSPVDASGPMARWFGDGVSAEGDACHRWLSSVDPAGYREAYSVFAAEDGPSPAKLTRMPAPAFFFTGAEEPNSTPAMSEAMAATAPKGEVRVLNGAAHMMPMTHPEETSAALRDFFRRSLS